MSLLTKDPGARTEYRFDWAAAYLAGRSITLSQWTAEPDEPGGLAIESHAQQGGMTSAVLSGGREGVSYRLTNRVTLSDGQIDERALTIKVEQR